LISIEKAAVQFFAKHCWAAVHLKRFDQLLFGFVLAQAQREQAG
jgi:hypothetical protein